MCDSFDMACHDASNSLHLNIKVNSENLLPNAQKYNVGSLRLPADPSWPKIPQRRLADDLGEIIEPPCVVRLTDTPRKSRTTVRSSNSHLSSKSTYGKDHVPGPFHQHIYQKIPPTSHPIKRRPGCADPRFKRVTTVKSQMTSTDPPDREREKPTELSRSALIIPNQTQCMTENVRKTVPEKDTDTPKVTQQEAEKPGEIKGMDSIGVQTTIDGDSTNDNSKKKDDLEISREHEGSRIETVTENCELSPRAICDSEKEQNLISQKSLTDLKSCDESTVKRENDAETQKIDCPKDENNSPNLTIVNNPINVLQQESACLQYCQGNTGQFFLVVENKAKPSSLGTMQIDSNSDPACQFTTQCYNVQVPVLSYQNLQISTQQPPKVDISSQLSLSPVLRIPSTPSIKNPINNSFDITNENFPRISKDPETLRNEASANVAKSNNPQPAERKSMSSDPKNTCNVSQIEEKNKNIIASDLEAQRTRKMLATPPVKLERKNDQDTKFSTLKINQDGISENFKASRVQQLLSDTTDSEMYENKQMNNSRARLYSKETSGSGSDYEAHFEHRSKFQNDDFQQMKKKQENPAYCSIATSQEIVYSRNYGFMRDQESSIDDRESSKPHKDTKHVMKNNRKMKSEQNLPRSLPFFGKSYKNVSDPHITTRKNCSSNARRTYDNRQPEVTTDIKEMSFNLENTDCTTDEVDSEIPHVPDFCDTQRTDLSNIEESKNPAVTALGEQTSSLPVKTQQLLNKSYMEYYDKLQSGNVVKSEGSHQRYVCQMAMGAPQLKKRRAEIQPEVLINDVKRNTKTEVLTMEKLSALSNIINRNLNPPLRNSSDTMHTKQIYVNENMKSSSDPTAFTHSAVVLRKNAIENSADLYDSSVPSSTLINKLKRKREKPLVERRLLKLKTIAFFGFMMYAMIVLLPMMYTYFMYDDYEDYEDLSYIELMLEYVISSFREAFGGLFDTINKIFFRPRTCRKCNNAA